MRIDSSGRGCDVVVDVRNPCKRELAVPARDGIQDHTAEE